MTRGRPPLLRTTSQGRPQRRMPRFLLAATLLGASVLPSALVWSGPAMADGSEVTVAAPAGGTVTVEKTVDLVNEVIKVSWEGFVPSDNPISDLFDEGQTRYPVRVYQCRGADPVAPTDCYGSLVYDYPGRESPIPNYDLGRPDGPSNWVQLATSPNGSGSVDLEVLTKKESVTLGCTEEQPCSVVVVPNLGDQTRQDSIFPEFPACATVYDVGGTQCNDDGLSGNSIDAPWAWTNRVVVPLEFAPTGAVCDFADAEASLLGSPKAERVLTSWQPATCTADQPVSFTYTAQGEGIARTAFMSGLTDVALTSRPIDPAVEIGDRPHTYAPVAVSALAVAFRVDDAVTHEPITEMRLTPRLLAKLVTGSYGYVSWSPDGVDWGNPANRGNPITLFDDPEFLELNPGPSWPLGINNACATPILLADRSDLTYELTRYLQADPTARAYLDGEEDAWGAEVNTYFEDIVYPAEAFELRDPDKPLSYAFQPVQGLNQVARKLVTNAFAGTLSTDDSSVPPKPQKCGPGNTGVQPPGSRAFVAVVDTANAAAYRFPVAALANAAGEFVVPDEAGMAAGLAAMTVNPDGITRSPDVAATDPAVYPLTMVDYAVVPTSATDEATAEAVARVLDHAAGAGQERDVLVGGLPPGHLPLDAELRAQTEAAAAAVRAQAGAPAPTDTPTPTTTAALPPGAPVAPPPAAPGGPAAIAPPAPGVPVPAGAADPSVAATDVALAPMMPVAAQTPAWFSLVLPAVLLGGLATALVGSSVLGLAGRPGPVTLLRRIRVRRPGRPAS